jgi:tetratricopeptide (TPR) repeat protein
MIAACLLVLGLCAPQDPAALPRADAARWSSWVSAEAPAAADSSDYMIGLRAYSTENLPVALRHALKALEQEPDYPPALLLGSACLYRLRRYGDAIELYERLLEHVPADIVRTRQLGHCYHSLGRSAEALAHYERLLKVRPKDLAAKRARGVVRFRLGDATGALADLDAVLAQRPTDGEALYWRAALLYDEEHTEEALKAARRACEAAPFSSRGWFLRAQAANEVGEVQESEQARAQHKHLLDVESAVRPLEQRLLREPGNLDALESLARLLLGAGDLRRAEGIYQRLQRSAQAAGNTEVAERAA